MYVVRCIFFLFNVSLVVRERRAADAAAYAEEFRKLAQCAVLRDKWSILYLLYTLSGDDQKV